MCLLLTLPETLVWYALMPASVRGLACSIRHRLRDVLPILVFAVTLTLAYALMQGNVGTAYRQRTQVTMFFFVFMDVGIVVRQRRRTSATEVGEFNVSPGLAVATAEPAAPGLIEDHDFVYPDGAGPAKHT